MKKEILKQIEHSQENEITEYHIYMKLSRVTKKAENAEVLRSIAEEEKSHADIWKKYTGKDARPRKLEVFFYYWISRIFGLTFGIKLMERGEEEAQINYDAISVDVPEAKQISIDENGHENKLIEMLDEDRLKYMGSIVLGLNDALVELTGALAGLTFALANTRLIAAAGLITGIAASFSMAASEYLSNRAEGNDAVSVKSAVYTGIAYIITVVLLVLPYFIFNNYLICLACTMCIALLIIFLFNYYISVARDFKFFPRFAEMALLSIGVAAITFVIGFVIRTVMGVEV
ncbi:MAG: VIT1/CCC1 transporter family protein [Spirochaetota bacterium]